MFRKIMVGSDGSDSARRALKAALDLAAKYESSIEVISIIERRPKFATSISEAKMVEEREREHFEEVHRAAQLEAAKHGVDLSSRIVPGHEVTTLIDHARKEKIDLIVIGHRGHSTRGRARTGTTARALAEESPCPILIV
jgi:nucleotide-binding universal stress UspA family protein